MLVGALFIAFVAGAAVEVPPCSPAKVAPEPVVEIKDGRKVTEGMLRAGARDGRWTFYWPNGFKKEESSYCAGVRHGAATFWTESGHPELEGAFENGVPRGAWTFWSSTRARRVFYPRPGRPTGDFFLDEGTRALVRDDAELAASLLRIALRNAPDDPKVHRSLGVLSAKTGDAPRAAFHYRRYVELDPTAKDRAVVENFLAAYERERTAGPAASTSGGASTTTAPPATVPPATSGSEAKPEVTRTPITVVTDRPGRVIVDGTVVEGSTPLDGARALSLTPGPHRVELLLEGSPPISQVLSVFVEGTPGPARIELVVGERLKVEGPIVVEPAPP